MRSARIPNAVGIFAACLAPAAAQSGNRCNQGTEAWTSPNGEDGSNVVHIDFSGGRRMAPPNEPRNLHDLRAAIAEKRALQADWDGYGAVAPNEKVIEIAGSLLKLALLNSQMPAPALVPVADGGLQAEWYSPDYRFELYVEPDGAISAWSQDRHSGAEQQADGQDAVALLLNWSSLAVGSGDA